MCWISYSLPLVYMFSKILGITVADIPVDYSFIFSFLHFRHVGLQTAVFICVLFIMNRKGTRVPQ
jgi:hypothetical protein